VEYRCFKAFFENIAKGTFGNVVRAKALVKTDRGPFKFDVVYGKQENEPFPEDVTDSRLVVIGTAIDRNALMSASGPGPV
jgi:hypothetical protein